MFTGFGGLPSGIGLMQVSPDDISNVPSTDTGVFLYTFDPSVGVVTGTLKRGIHSPSAFETLGSIMGFTWSDIIKMPASVINSMPRGPSITDDNVMVFAEGMGYTKQSPSNVITPTPDLITPSPDQTEVSVPVAGDATQASMLAGFDFGSNWPILAIVGVGLLMAFRKGPSKGIKEPLNGNGKW